MLLEQLPHDFTVFNTGKLTETWLKSRVTLLFVCSHPIGRVSWCRPPKFTLLSGVEALLVYGLSEHIFSFWRYLSWMLAKLPRLKGTSLGLAACTGSLKKTCCTFVGGGWEPNTQKRWQRMRFHRCRVYVGGGLGIWQKRRKSLRRSAPCTGLLRVNELLFAR